MSSAKRISVEEVIQQVEDEDFDFLFEGSDEDFGLNSSSDDIMLILVIMTVVINMIILIMK